jgi:hypothetical protein
MGKYNHYQSLSEIKSIISIGSFKAENIIDRSRVTYLFVLIRKLIDCLSSKKEREKYRLLKFYCTWTLHVDMDRNEECILKIKEISKLMYDNKANSNLRAILTTALSLNSIPQQINDLIISCGMTTKETINERAWKQIEPILIGLISTAPLMDKSGKEYVKEISVIALPGVFFGWDDLPLDKSIFGFKLITKDNKPGEFTGVAMLDISGGTLFE